MLNCVLAGAARTEAVDPQFEKRPSIFATPEITGEELIELLDERFKASPVKVLDSYDERRDPRFKIHADSFTLKTDLKYNPEVKVVYRIPLRSKYTAGPDADNIVLRAFWPGSMEPMTTKEVDGKEVTVPSTNLESSLTYYSDSLGYTAFSIYIHSPREMWSDPKESYFLGGKEWVDIVFRAQDEIIKRHKLKTKGLLLVGHSLGGTFIQRIAAARPDRVAGVSVHSAPDVIVPKEKSDTAWFLGFTRGDSMRTDFEKLHSGLLDLEGNLVFSVFPPNYDRRGQGGNFYHSVGKLADAGSRSFLRGVVDRMNSKGEVDVTKWPYVRDRYKALRILPVGHRDAQLIPEENREFLPSRKFVEILQSLPVPIQFVNIADRQGDEVKCLVGLPPLGRPRGVLLYCQEFDFRELPEIIDNLYYFAEKGYVVIAPRLGPAPENEITAALEYLRTAKIFDRTPLVLLGKGPAGGPMWQTVALERRIQPKAVAMMEFEPGDLLDESKLPPGCGIKSPVMFVYDEAPLANVGTSSSAKESLRKVSTIKEFIATCGQRNQLARVSFISKDVDSAGKVSQQSVQAAATFLTNVVENRITEIAP